MDDLINSNTNGECVIFTEFQIDRIGIRTK